MPQVLRLDDGDVRVQYAPPEGWETVVNSGREWNQDGSYHRAKAVGAQLFFLFRGTGISLYGLTGRGGAAAQLQLDGKRIDALLNEGNSSDTTTRLLSFPGLEDGDHQLYIFMWTLEGQNTVNVTVDYFEITNDKNTGFDLSWAGPNATNVPKDAILVESSNQDIQLSNSAQWANTNDLRFYRRNTWYTNSHGASLKYAFEGVAIWFYASVDTPHGFYTISLDDSKPERLSSTNPIGQLTQQMLWSKVGLTPGRHTLTLTQDDDNGKYVNLNYFRVLRNADASVLPASAFTTSSESTTFSINPTASTAPTLSSPSNSSTVFLAVGLSVGLLILGAVILFAFLYKRRSRRKRRSLELELDTRLPTPHFIEPFTTGPVVRKQPLLKSSHQTQNQPEASESSNSVLETLSSPGPTSIGLPPSYESHFRG